MFWKTSPEGPLLPPIPKRMPGRPAKKRKQEPLEGKNKSKTKLSRSGRVFKCGICHKEGHNRVKCMRKASNVTYDAVGSSGRETQGNNRKRKEKGVDSVIASNINPSGQKSEQSNKRKRKEKGRSDSATIENIAPTGQRTQQGRRKKGKKLIDVASEHKRASFKDLKGADTGEEIVGREVAHGSSFMTSSELLALSSRRIAARENKNKEANHQASAAFETPDISTTQQSMIT